MREELPNEVVRDEGKPRWYHGIGGLSGRISLQLCPSFEHGHGVGQAQPHKSIQSGSMSNVSVRETLTFLVAGRMLLARSGLLDVFPALFRVAQGGLNPSENVLSLTVAHAYDP